MRRSSKKALILNNFTSPYIYQAIVILSEDGAKHETKALKDAERIVSEYFANTKEDENDEDIILYSRPKRSAPKRFAKIALGIALTSLLLCLFLLCR